MNDQNTNDDIDTDEVEQEDKEFEEAFETSDGPRMSPESRKEAAAKEVTDDTGESGATSEADEDASSTDVDDDPWKDVPPVVKNLFDKQQEDTGKKIDQIFGKIGEIVNIQKTMEKAKTESEDAGATAVPDKQTVEDALKDVEKFKQLEEEFPDYAASLTDSLKAFDVRLEEQQKQLREEMKKELKEEIGDSVSAQEVAELVEKRVESRMEEMPLRIKYPDYQETVHTDGFINYLIADGPSREEFDDYKQSQAAAFKAATEGADDAESLAQATVDKLNGLIKSHPKWWADKGSLYDSEKITDNISLLDSYEASKKGKPASNSRNNKRRLEENLQPDGVTGRIDTTPSDEEDFEESFNS